jgi:Arylsulfotransferase (ASST)
VSQNRLTRAELLRRAGAGAAGVAAAGGGAYGISRLFHDAAAAAKVLPATPAGRTHRFHSRPDLRPPVVTVIKKAHKTGDGYLMLSPSSGPGQRGPLIVDNAGNVVWFRSTGEKKAMNLRAALYKGQPVLTWWEGDVGKEGLGLGEHVIVDSSYREIARFPVGNRRGGDLHEFVLTPDGTALVTAWAKVTRNVLALGGSRRHTVVDGIAQEIEIPAARVLFEWRSLDHVPLAETHAPAAPNFDYFHINSIDLAPDGDWIVSARNTWTIYKVSRRTGQVVWRLGGKKSDFAMGPMATFAWQHDARAHGDGTTISLFDDGAAPAVEKQSRGLVIQLDEAKRRATLSALYRHRPNRLLAHYMGSMQVLPNRNAVVGWGSEPYITEFADDGSIAFDARLPRAGQTYRVVRMPWAGRPTERPNLASGRAGGKALLYASWNGATGLDRWHVRTGSRAANLADAATVPATGFETAIELVDEAAYAAVTALDAAGKPLGSSRAVRA